MKTNKKPVPLYKLSKSTLLKKYDAAHSKWMDTEIDRHDLELRVKELEETLALQTKRHLDQIIKLNAEVKDWKDRFMILLVTHAKFAPNPPAGLPQ